MEQSDDDKAFRRAYLKGFVGCVIDKDLQHLIPTKREDQCVFAICIDSLDQLS